MTDERGPGTRCVWAGEEELFWEGATQVPVVHSVTYGYEDLDEWYRVGKGEQPGHIYSRNTNPTVRPLEAKLAALEGAEEATSFSTGMAAISGTLHTLLGPGDRVVTIKDTYGGTNKIFIEFLPRLGVDVQLCTTEDHDAIEAEIAKGCKVVYLETPTNPTLKVMDVERLAAAGKAVGATVVVDSTFATPINQRPLELGADLVIHSATKYLGGHSDALGGLIAGSRELVRRVYHYREINGATMHPTAAFLILRGMKTLALRVERQNANGLQVAEFLDGHPAIDEVFYPGLPGHRLHDVARKQMSGFGGMLSFSMNGGWPAVEEMLPKLELVHLAASLGSVATLAGPPRTTSHVELSAEERAAAGIPESLIRYSVGIEDGDDLVADLKQALEGL